MFCTYLMGSIVRSVCQNFLRAGSYTSMLLSEHFFAKESLLIPTYLISVAPSFTVELTCPSSTSGKWRLPRHSYDWTQTRFCNKYSLIAQQFLTTLWIYVVFETYHYYALSKDSSTLCISCLYQSINTCLFLSTLSINQCQLPLYLNLSINAYFLSIPSYQSMPITL